jgi:hypothetical protein
MMAALKNKPARPLPQVEPQAPAATADSDDPFQQLLQRVAHPDAATEAVQP